MNSKDLFSQHSKSYAQFRPTYPKELYDFLYAHCQSFDLAWDCATGNGQAARELALRFKKVYATDISEKQIESAYTRENIFYSVARAEKTSFESESFDLITVAQAFHWLDVTSFMEEVKRVAKPKAMVAVWGYSLLSINQEIDEIMLSFYKNTIGSYWDKERRHVDEAYQDLPFPLNEIKAPSFDMSFEWTRDDLLGYVNTWSAVQKYISRNGENPVDQLTLQIRPLWLNPTVKVTFPIFMRLGSV
ncbi:MAG: methyltransferase domain-containing protein [Bacteroidetes bacterium]|nr:methyltransferase domain-containing protein [Bacteroidota bacterium]